RDPERLDLEQADAGNAGRGHLLASRYRRADLLQVEAWTQLHERNAGWVPGVSSLVLDPASGGSGLEPRSHLRGEVRVEPDAGTIASRMPCQRTQPMFDRCNT